MLAISISGRALELPKQEINTTWQNIVFSGVLANQFTTDIEIPLTQNNRDIFKLYGLIDGNVIFNKRIDCSISTNTQTCDGYIEVSKVTRKSITATVFFNDFPYELFEKNCSDILKDGTGTINEWDDITPLLHYGDIGIGLASYRNYDGIDWALLHPSIRVTDYFQRLGNAIGVNFSFPDLGGEKQRFVATNRYVCPENKKQVIGFVPTYLSASDNKMEMRGGQHICNNAKWEKDGQTSITFNRDCVVRLTLYCGSSGALMSVMINGTSVLSVASTVPSTTVVTIYEGDVLTYVYAPLTVLQDGYQLGVLLLQYQSYQIEESDYEREELELMPSESLSTFGFLIREPPYLQDTSGVRITTFDGAIYPRWSWRYFGLFCNLPRCTITELLSNLCWFYGGIATFDGETVTMTSSLKSKILTDGEVLSVGFQSDKLGKKTTANYSGGYEVEKWLPKEAFEINIANDFLDENVDIFTSIFGRTQLYLGFGIYSTDAYISLYARPSRDSGDYVHTDFGWAICSERDWGLNLLALDCVPIRYMGLSEITECIEVEIETLNNVVGNAFVFLDGRKYIVIDSDTESDSETTTLRAILV